MVNQLASMITAHGPTLVLSGAGMSTASGLPDFRSSSGLWRDRRCEELASIDMFQREPAAFWEFYRMRVEHLRTAVPNNGHVLLARLERAGHISCVVTQNVDGLHARAGSTVLEMHGSLERARCMMCGAVTSMNEALARTQDDVIPMCACGTMLRPDVVLFGEMLPPAFEDAIGLVHRCTSLLVLGTSLQVEPVASIVRLAAARRAHIGIVNMGETTSDDLAEVRIDGDIVETLCNVAALLQA